MAAPLVAVTGATGFIGRAAVAALHASGAEVREVARSTGHDLLVPGAETSAVDGASHLLHLAWHADPRDYWTSLENARWVEATTRLATAFARQGGRRMVVAGTCAEYSWTGDGLLSEERTPLAPATPYGASKRAAQALLEAWDGCSTAWGRLFFLHGPGEPAVRLVPAVATALLEGREARVTAGTQRRDFLHVDDVAAALCALLRSEVQGAVNIGSGEAPEVREVVRAIGEAAGRPDLLRFGAIPQREGDPPEIRADTGRLREEVGWTPSLSLRAGIRHTVDALR